MHVVLLPGAAVAPFAVPFALPIDGKSPLPDSIFSETLCAEFCANELDCSRTHQQSTGRCWLVKDVSGSAGVRRVIAAVSARGPRGTCCLNGEPHCSGDLKQQPHRCHHAAWACTACGQAGLDRGGQAAYCEASAPHTRRCGPRVRPSSTSAASISCAGQDRKQRRQSIGAQGLAGCARVSGSSAQATSALSLGGTLAVKGAHVAL